jgi:hypothetical protein
MVGKQVLLTLLIDWERTKEMEPSTPISGGKMWCERMVFQTCHKS